MHEGTLTVASRTTRSRAVEGVFIALTCLVFVLWAGLFIRESSFVSSDGVRRFCLADDAMISMRYAWNLAHGSGLVWNPGERVEGITNLLMTLLMATLLLVLSKGAAVLAVQLLGIVFVLLTAFFAWRVVLSAAPPPPKIDSGGAAPSRVESSESRVSLLDSRPSTLDSMAADSSRRATNPASSRSESPPKVPWTHPG